MSVQNEIDKAISAHEMWKLKLRKAIDTGHCESAVDKAKMDDNCAFGKWLHERIDPSIKNTPYYDEILDLHAQFHKEAGIILSLALNGEKDQANELFADGQTFSNCSDLLTKKMREWQATL